MKVWYKNIGDTKATFFSDENSTIERPDESSFLSGVPVDYWVNLYTIVWDVTIPSLVMDANHDSELEKKTVEYWRKLRLTEIQPEYVRRIEYLTSKPYKSPEREMDAYQRILNKIRKGEATPGQVALLDTVDALREDAEGANVEDYIEDEARTLQELQDYVITDNAHWTDPVPAP